MTDYPYIYAVYILVEDMAEDVWEGDDYATACRAFDETVEGERIRQARGDYAEATVHLYEPNTGNLHAEACIPAQLAPTIRA